MKKLKEVLIAITLLMFVISCEEFYPGNGCFYVDHVEFYDKIYKYRLVSTKGNNSIYVNSDKKLYYTQDTICLPRFNQNN